ncbi:MAG: thiolase family protein [Candidatus Vecturithrix sp.]|jgi:acetyl-CoA C-acetyltransferase|nr:thiolase family protein [Candidatus Vecturithrix sp.]
MPKIYIVNAVRSAGGSYGGSLQEKKAAELGAIVIRELLHRANVSGDILDEVIFGNAWQAGVGPNPARLCSVGAGIPVTVPAVSVNVRCGSSLKALIMGTHAILSGEENTVIVGGTESASQVPYLLEKARWGYRMGNAELIDVLHHDGFRCPLAEGLMGEITERLVEKYQISREEQDTYACMTQQRAVETIKQGVFKQESVGIELVNRKTKESVLFDTDEIPREGITVDKLAKLKPVFKTNGTITAGNSSALCDAAAAVLLMSENKVQELGVSPMAEIVATSFVGIAPQEFGLAPVPAVQKVLHKSGLSLADMDLIELNEAFAAQVIACDRELHIDRNKLNVHGGAIALGHPIAATGAKILTTLLYALKRQGKEFGLCTLCIGGGNGVAVIVKVIH